jgi:hypothetical protein
MKKKILIAAVLAIAIIVPVVSVKAMSNTEITNQINSMMSQLQQLQTVVAQMGSTSGTADTPSNSASADGIEAANSLSCGPMGEPGVVRQAYLFCNKVKDAAKLLTGGVDLVVEYKSASGSISNGAKYITKALIANYGPGSYSGPIKVVLTQGSGSSQGKVIAEQTINGIGAFETKGVNFSSIFSGVPHATYYMWIVADYGNAIQEKNEGNNNMPMPVTVNR